MQRTTFIRRFLALALLIVFSFGITPKRYLHDIFAGHEDAVANVIVNSEQQISQKSVHCDCNTIVATSPYTSDDSLAELPELRHFSTHYISIQPSLPQHIHEYSELRGPPSIG